MEPVCPKCNQRLSEFDINETGACPKCARLFSKGDLLTIEHQCKTPVESENQDAYPKRDPANPALVLFLWLIHLVGPPIVGLQAASMSHDGNFLAGLLGGIAVAVVTSVMLASKAQMKSSFPTSAILLFLVTFVVSGVILFGGCALLMMGLH